MRISAIIPTLDEQDALPHYLADLARQSGPVEVIVADSGSRDRTVEIARAGRVELPTGRVAPGTPRHDMTSMTQGATP